MTKLRRVRRILISSKDVTGVTSENSDAVKFANQATLRWRKNVKMGRTKPYIGCLQSSITLWMLLASDHLVVPKSSPSCFLVTEWKPCYPIHLSPTPSGPKSVTKWSQRSRKVINYQRVRIWSSKGSQGSQMVCKLFPKSPQVVRNSRQWCKWKCVKLIKEYSTSIIVARLLNLNLYWLDM